MHKIVYVKHFKMENAYTQIIPLTQTIYSHCAFEVLLSRAGNTQIRLHGVHVGRLEFYQLSGQQWSTNLIKMLY